MDLCQRLPGIVAQLVWRCSKIFSRLLNLFRKYSELLTAITLLYFYFTLYFVSGEESFGHIHYVHGSIFRHAEL